MLPAHSAAEIAARVHFESVTFSSSTFSSLFLSTNNTLDCWSFQWRLPGEMRCNGLKYLLCAGWLRDAGSRLLLSDTRQGWVDLRVAGTKALGSLMDRWGRCRSCPCSHLTCMDSWETNKRRRSFSCCILHGKQQRPDGRTILPYILKTKLLLDT